MSSQKAWSHTSLAQLRAVSKRVATPLHACGNDEALSFSHMLMVMACDEADTRH
jgi:hypothetical protein